MQTCPVCMWSSKINSLTSKFIMSITKNMYSSTFIFAKKQFDEEFHRLDQAISLAAKNTPGYLGEEAWENTTTGLVSNVYYWESLEALQALVQHPKHLEAKAAQANWLDGYQVVISQVIKTYGDSKLGALPTSRISG
jgi:heme-degrading monooxygenase HmoA